MTTINVIQDGDTFFDDDTGDVLFRADYPVRDFDLDAAQRCRGEFVMWMNRERSDDDIIWIAGDSNTNRKGTR